MESKAHRRRPWIETETQRGVDNGGFQPRLILRGGQLGDGTESFMDGGWKHFGRVEESGEGTEEIVVRKVQVREDEIAGFQIGFEMLEKLKEQGAVDLLEHNRVGEDLRGGHTSLSLRPRSSRFQP